MFTQGNGKCYFLQMVKLIKYFAVFLLIEKFVFLYFCKGK